MRTGAMPGLASCYGSSPADAVNVNPRIEACSSRRILARSQHIGRGNQVRPVTALGLHHVGHTNVSISQIAWCTDPQDHPGLLLPLLEVADHIACLVFAIGSRWSIHRSQVFLRQHTKLLTPDSTTGLPMHIKQVVKKYRSTPDRPSPQYDSITFGRSLSCGQAYQHLHSKNSS